MSLASNINQLINTHIAMNARGKIVKQPALLTQLTDFIGATGNSGSSERPIPGSIKALSLHVQLEWDARNHQYKLTGDDSGGIWSILQHWDATITDTGNEWELFLEHVTQDWIDQIKACIDPPRARRPLRQPCSACGQRWYYDEDNKRAEAVTAWVWTSNGEHIAPVQDWEVHCSACNAQWTGKEVAKAYWRAPR